VSFHLRLCALILVAAIVVPTSLSAVVVVSEDECVLSDTVVFGVSNVGDSVEFLSESPLHNLVLLVLVELLGVVEMELVVVGIRHNNLGLLHVE